MLWSATIDRSFLSAEQESCPPRARTFSKFDFIFGAFCLDLPGRFGAGPTAAEGVLLIVSAILVAIATHTYPRMTT